ncbi:DUF4360 domain-containing protein [Polyangium jinanense]|uniref:DUF4360 domain-containing protein n=1 Tax=Polyangium jinanense TaxID=2829994 RepID=A0A9X3WWQ5_9BACT|nr:DUF4360 domain-containing protein [Polyangium jinanense]MDC3953291.1 DUF4360 domain-containing protein [Polyangium jinanense]MDC3979589.1 DUF4360 domain-containing protein [Polyangium jinanense]
MRHFALSFLAFSAAIAAFSAEARAEAPEAFSIRDLKYSGPGCPEGSVAYLASQDAEAFTILFSKLYAEVGPNVDRGNAKKRCNLNILFDFPAGWSFAIEGGEVRGYAFLEAGLSGIIRSTYSFPGLSREERAFEIVLQGEMADNYENHDVVTPDRPVPCTGRKNLHIKTDTVIDDRFARGKSGLLTVDSVDGVVRQTYRLRWTRCR